MICFARYVWVAPEKCLDASQMKLASREALGGGGSESGLSNVQCLDAWQPEVQPITTIKCTYQPCMKSEYANKKWDFQKTRLDAQRTIVIPRVFQARSRARQDCRVSSMSLNEYIPKTYSPEVSKCPRHFPACDPATSGIITYTSEQPDKCHFKLCKQSAIGEFLKFSSDLWP